MLFRSTLWIKENIDLKRRDVEYAEFFIDDKDWDNYIKGADIFVGHNIEYFDSKFMLDGRTEKKIEEFDMICTMILNIFEVKAEFEYPTPSDYSPYKYPSLYETAKFYGVDFDLGSFTAAYMIVRSSLRFLKRWLIKDF